MSEQFQLVVQSVVAWLIASMACGLGALPLVMPKPDMKHRIGIGYAFAGGLMFVASVSRLPTSFQSLTT